MKSKKIFNGDKFSAPEKFLNFSRKEFLLLLFGITFVFIMLISFSGAIEFQKVSKNNVLIPEFNHPAEFELTLTDVPLSEYIFYTFADVDIIPNDRFKLSSGTNYIGLKVYAQERLKSHKGFYTFQYTLKDKIKNIDYNDRITLKIVPLKEALEISSNSIYPDTDEINFYIQNKENAKLENVTAKFVSIFFNYELTFDITPLGKTEITIPINRENAKKIRAGVYIVNAEFNTDSGKEIVEGKLYWGEKKGIVTQDAKDGFLIITHAISKMNIGNVQQEEKIEMKKNIFSRLFTSFNIEPTSIKREGFNVRYTWIDNLGPTESLNVKARTNYILPLILIFLLVVIVYSYLKYSERKIEIKKSVSHVKTKGGEFALKVRLHVKAKGSVSGVSLVDRIPILAKVHEKLWTVSPKKIDTINRRIYWDLGDMSMGEERVFSYVIYSKVGVVGKFTIPEAVAIFDKEGKIKEVNSNKVFFLSEQIKKD